MLWKSFIYVNCLQMKSSEFSDKKKNIENISDLFRRISTEKIVKNHNKYDKINILNSAPPFYIGYLRYLSTSTTLIFKAQHQIAR